MTKTERALWIPAVGTALALGLYFRLSGFYTWPLAVDEFYIYKAMTFVVESGLPQFPCGGYYTRGLLYQYVTVPLLYLGISPEAALRSITIASNIMMFPAAFLLARRLGGYRIASIVMIVLALSAWEIEMSRFGRMYAPFQMLFVWYVYHAYCLITDFDARRWRWLFLLSIIGPLLWEGAIVLALFNFVPFLINRKYGNRHLVIGSFLILATSIGFLQTDFRSYGQPTDISTSVPTMSSSGIDFFLDKIGSIMPTIIETPISALMTILLLLSFAFLIGRAVVRETIKTGESIVIALSSIALLANQILVAILILGCALLLGWVRMETLRKREVRLVALLMFATCMYFVLTAIVGDFEPTLTARIRVLISFPDILYAIVYPWLFNIPIMSFAIVVCAVAGAWFCLVNRDSNSRGARLLMVFVIVAIGVIGIVPTQYNETRYSFFLYPLLICVSGYAIHEICLRLRTLPESVTALVPAAFVGLFLVSSDFAFAHLANIDTYTANFRVGYSDQKSRHYYPRTDFRSPAEFVNKYASSSDLIVISSVVYAEYLYSPDAVYLDQADRRYKGQKCADQKSERWTTLPLISSLTELRTTIEADMQQQSWIIVDQQTAGSRQWDDLISHSPSIKEVYKSPDRQSTVYVYAGM